MSTEQIETAKRGRRRAGRRDFGSIKDDGTSTNPRFSVTWWESGTQRRKRGVTTRTDASAFLAAKRVELDEAPPECTPVAPMDVTIKTAIDAYEAYRRAP